MAKKKTKAQKLITGGLPPAGPDLRTGLNLSKIFKDMEKRRQAFLRKLDGKEKD